MGAVPQPFGDLSHRLRRMEEQSRRITNASPFSGTPIRPQADGTVNSDDFDGDILAGDAGTKGWALSTDTAAFGDLLLRGEIISNDSLISPVIPGVVNAIGTGVSVSAGVWGTVASRAVTVPAGCSRLLAHVTGAIYAVNPNTTGGSNGSGGDILEVRCSAGSVDGLAMAVSISGSNGQTSCTGSVAALLTGLTPGASVTIKTQAMSGLQSFGANAFNQANASATLQWLR